MRSKKGMSVVLGAFAILAVAVGVLIAAGDHEVMPAANGVSMGDTKVQAIGPELSDEGDPVDAFGPCCVSSCPSGWFAACQCSAFTCNCFCCEIGEFCTDFNTCGPGFTSCCCP